MKKELNFNEYQALDIIQYGISMLCETNIKSKISNEKFSQIQNISGVINTIETFHVNENYSRALRLLNVINSISADEYILHEENKEFIIMINRDDDTTEHKFNDINAVIDFLDIEYKELKEL